MKNNEIKLLALDLDGTTLRSNNTLSDKVKNALDRAVANGITVVAASGRPYGTMPECITSISGVDFLVTSNGAAVYDKDRKRVHSKLLPEKEVLRILELSEGENIIFEAYMQGLTYTDKKYADDPVKYGCTEAYIDYVRSSHGHIEDMRKFIYEHRAELDSIEYICVDRETRERVRKRIGQSTDNLFVTSSSENFVEFMTKTATKANGVEYVCSQLGLERENVAACGNADNDADMIKWAGLGAAVKNASKSCVDVADIVVASNNDDGVAFLVDYILEQNRKAGQN